MGAWKMAPIRRSAGVMFSAGKKVEISLDSEGHQESWFPATVLEGTKDGIFRTQYEIQDKNGVVGHLNAVVDSLHIRPCPPHLKDKNFFLLEKVDAFYDCCWRSGVITKELADSRYIVFFKQSNKETEFNHSELRPHMEWKNWKWFTSSQEVLIPSDYQSHDVHLFNSTNNMSEIAVSFRNSGSTKSISEDKLLSKLNPGENQVELSTPSNEKPLGVAPDIPSDFMGKKKSTKEIPTKTPSQTVSPISTNTTEAPSEGKISNVVSPRSESVGNNFSKQPLGGDQSSDNHSWGKRFKRRRMKSDALDNSRALVVRKTNEGFTDAPDDSRALVVKKTNEGFTDAPDGSRALVVKKTNEGFTAVPVERAQNSIDGLACDTMRSSTTKKSCQSTVEESSKKIGDLAGLDDAGLHSVKVIDQFELGEKSVKRRRGRPPKSAMKNSILSLPEEPNKSIAADGLFKNDSLGTVEVKTSVDTNGSGKKVRNSNQIKQKHRQGVTSTLPRTPNEEVAEDPIKQHERHSQRRGRKRTINVNAVSQVHDSSNASERKQANSNSIRKDLEMVTKESSNMPDDQPLSKWFEGMHSQTVNDGSSKLATCILSSYFWDILQIFFSIGVPPPRNVEDRPEASSGQLAIIVRETPSVENKDGGVGKAQCLPFIKNTILWSTIESMEVFQKMPQKPHFRPLVHCKESSREGLAIGCMVTFSSVVERTSRLQFDDPRNQMDEILETLVELESHGFDVELVRYRVASLLAGKERQANLESQIEEIDREIGKHEVEKTKIDEEVDKIRRQIKGLEGKLSEAMSKKEKENVEIASLKSQLQGIREDMRSIQCDFEGLVRLL